PPDQSAESRRKWFSSIAKVLPPDKLPEFAEKLLKSEYGKVTRGSADEYFYVYSIPGGAGKNLVIVSSEEPTLAFLDGSSVMVLSVGLAGLLILSIAYLLLSRFIFSPFKKIREYARQAGRTVAGAESDVDIVVAEYEAVINDLKDNERELRRLNQAIADRANSLERFNEYLLTSMNSGVITLDRDGKIVTVNAAAGRMLGVIPETSRGLDFRRLIKGQGDLWTYLRDVLHDQDASGYRECTFSNDDGEEVTLGVTVSGIRNDNREHVGISILLSDLTELNHLREELETRHRLAAMGEMAGGLAHQLRNSLAAIMGYGKLAGRKLSEADRSVTTVIDSLVQETTEAETLIRQFLDFTRPLAYQPMPVQLDSFVTELVQSFAVRSAYSLVRFDAVVPSDIEVEIDPLLFKQALANILENAVNAYQSGQGKVIVRGSVESDRVQLTVQDFGCGIPARDREKIFMPFFSRRPSGTGLGLSLASKIVDLHHGSIHIDSKVGEGTTFTVSIPLSRTVAGDEVAETAKTHSV
ncbi:MAG: ATP-binding protein, partial [Candidatus Zixiibacteriota bacterium]